MKNSRSPQISIICNFALSLLCSFQIGALYAAKPYRALATSAPSRLEFTQIAVRQSHTLMLVSFAAVVFSFLSLGSLLYARFRKKEPVHFPVPSRFARGSS